MFSSLPNFPRLPVVLCVVLRPCGPSLSNLAYPLIGVLLVQLTFGLVCWLDSMNIASDVTRRRNLTPNSLIPWLL